jgi:hypothetical protein
MSTLQMDEEGSCAPWYVCAKLYGIAYQKTRGPMCFHTWLLPYCCVTKRWKHWDASRKYHDSRCCGWVLNREPAGYEVTLIIFRVNVCCAFVRGAVFVHVLIPALGKDEGNALFLCLIAPRLCGLWGSGGIALRIPNRGIVWWVVSFTPRPFYSQGRNPPPPHPHIGSDIGSAPVLAL